VAWLAPIFYHSQDRGFPRKHPRSCSMGGCVAFGRLQKKLTPRKKNLTPRRKGAKKETGKGGLINNDPKGALGARRQKTDTPT